MKKFGYDARHFACWPDQLSGSILTRWYMMCALQFLSFDTDLASDVHSFNFWMSLASCWQLKLSGPLLDKICREVHHHMASTSFNMQLRGLAQFVDAVAVCLLVLTNTDLPCIMSLKNQEHYIKLEKIYVPELCGWPRTFCCSPPVGHTSTLTGIYTMINDASHPCRVPPNRCGREDQNQHKIVNIKTSTQWFAVQCNIVFS